MAKSPKKPAATGGPDCCKLGPADWENNMPALSLDHWNIYCKDLKATVRFYERYVGLHDGDRPPFPFPGAWLYAGDKPILHIVSETGRKDHGSGAIDHVAINCADIRGTIDQIKKDKIPFEVRKVPARPLQQVFVHDPDGVMIELNFWNEADVPEIDTSRTMPGERMKKTKAKVKAKVAA
jgi:catechol 2,3-dioxygenase-like lactoylglutathione lyase family enzyme